MIDIIEFTDIDTNLVPLEPAIESLSILEFNDVENAPIIVIPPELSPVYNDIMIPSVFEFTEMDMPSSKSVSVIEYVNIVTPSSGVYDKNGELLILSDNPNPTVQSQILGSASMISFNPTGGITEITVQKAIEQLDIRISISGNTTHFRYVQSVPASTWNINHDMRKRPSVTVTDSAGTTVEGSVQYIDENNITIIFSAGFSGFAELN
jgi:hypothetical protein